METNKNEMTKKYSWNFLLFLYLIGVIAMIYLFFAPIDGVISLYDFFTPSLDYQSKIELIMCVVGGKFRLQFVLFLCSVCFKAISLSIWLGKNI